MYQGLSDRLRSLALLSLSFAPGIALSQGPLCPVAPTYPPQFQNSGAEVHWGSDADEVTTGIYRMTRWVLNATDESRKITWPVARIQVLNLREGQFAVYCSGDLSGYKPEPGPLYYRRDRTSLPTDVYVGFYEPLTLALIESQGAIETSFRISTPGQSINGLGSDQQFETYVMVTTVVKYDGEQYFIDYVLRNIGSETLFIDIGDLPISLSREFEQPIEIGPGGEWNGTARSNSIPSPVWMPVRILDEDGRLRARYETQSLVGEDGWR